MQISADTNTDTDISLTPNLKVKNIILFFKSPFYVLPTFFFFLQIVAKRGENYLLCHGPKVHQELWGMSTRDAILGFIRDSCQLEDVPVTFYRLQKVMSRFLFCFFVH